MVRKVMRKAAVLEATGWPPSTLYLKISQKVFPKGTKLDPNGRPLWIGANAFEPV